MDRDYIYWGENICTCNILILRSYDKKRRRKKWIREMRDIDQIYYFLGFVKYEKLHLTSVLLFFLRILSFFRTFLIKCSICTYMKIIHLENYTSWKLCQHFYFSFSTSHQAQTLFHYSLQLIHYVSLASESSCMYSLWLDYTHNIQIV